jgi:hypothetical protein
MRGAAMRGEDGAIRGAAMRGADTCGAMRGAAIRGAAIGAAMRGAAIGAAIRGAPPPPSPLIWASAVVVTIPLERTRIAAMRMLDGNMIRTPVSPTPVNVKSVAIVSRLQDAARRSRATNLPDYLFTSARLNDR